jgi:Domain of unknown function (DUF4129)
MQRESPARLLLPALGVLLLVALVAIAATGSTPGGSGRTRQPGNEFLDTIFSLWLVLLAIAAALFVYGLSQRRAMAEELASQRKRRYGLVFLLILGSLLTAAYLEFARRHLHPLGFGSQGGLGNRNPSSNLQRGNLRDYHAQFAWIPVLVIFGLAGLAILAWVLAARRAQPDRARERVRETLEEVIEDTLDDLRAEADPRRAVIACYARLERALAAAGFGRRRAETQVEHLARILGELDIGTRSVRRLTDLYQRAKFSQHEVDVGMKEEAIAALVEVRDELRASEERRRELELLIPDAARP